MNSSPLTHLCNIFVCDNLVQLTHYEFISKNILEKFENLSFFNGLLWKLLDINALSIIHSHFTMQVWTNSTYEPPIMKKRLWVAWLHSRPSLRYKTEATYGMMITWFREKVAHCQLGYMLMWEGNPYTITLSVDRDLSNRKLYLKMCELPQTITTSLKCCQWPIHVF